jgi:hypothetical protein
VTLRNLLENAIVQFESTIGLLGDLLVVRHDEDRRALR